MQTCVYLIDLLNILNNEHLVAKIGFDTAENGLLKVCQKWLKFLRLEKVRINILDRFQS